MKVFGLNYAYNGTDFAPVSIVETQADGQSFTLNGIVTSSFMYLDNGATGDMAKSTANGGLQVGVEEWPNSFDAGNAWQMIKKEETAIFAPAGVADIEVDDTSGGITVIDSTYVRNLPNWTVYIKNKGGGSGDDFLDVWVEASPDETNWISLSTAESALEQEANTLTSGNSGIAMMGSNASISYIRLKAVCDTGEDTTADAWISANKN
jgi:hypothetical protein